MVSNYSSTGRNGVRMGTRTLAHDRNNILEPLLNIALSHKERKESGGGLWLLRTGLASWELRTLAEVLPCKVSFQESELICILGAETDQAPPFSCCDILNKVWEPCGWAILGRFSSKEHFSDALET